MSNTSRDIEDYRSTLERYYEKGLNDGRNEAWECANKISDIYSASERARIFNYVVGGITVMDILRDFTPQEALAKLEAYEKEQAEIKVEVGDVVKLQGEMVTEFVVTNIFSSRNYISYNGIASDGKFVADARNVEKTGKHIDIQSVLEQIKE